MWCLNLQLRRWLSRHESRLSQIFGLSLTGVAGPDSLEGHPAGTVFIGLAQEQGTEVIKVNIGGRSRADVRHIAVMHAFNLVRKALLSD